MRATLQVGDGDVIAEGTGALVVTDFRARDIAAGGEGAPISPLADLILFSSHGPARRAVLNLGGIANITVLDHDPRASSDSIPARRTRFWTGWLAGSREASSIAIETARSPVRDRSTRDWSRRS